MGLCPLPEINAYWENDKLGLFGNRLIQFLLPRALWYSIHCSITYQPDFVISKMNENLESFSTC